MTRSRWLKMAVVVLVTLLVLLLLRLHVAGAQPASGDPGAGRRLAEAWCTECHSIERGTAGKGTIAPDFTAIAARRDVSALWLHGFLRSPHRTMPNFIIAEPEASHIVAYILSLRRR